MRTTWTVARLLLLGLFFCGLLLSSHSYSQLSLGEVLDELSDQLDQLDQPSESQQNLERGNPASQTPNFGDDSGPPSYLSDIEDLLSTGELGMYVVYAEECANNFMMERSDSESIVEVLEEVIRRGISEGKISRQEVNQGVRAAETIIDMGGFTVEQQQMCQVFTMLIRQHESSPDRF